MLTTITQEELRDRLDEVLRRVDAGETFQITVHGQPVAELSPADGHRWVSGQKLDRVWQTPTPNTLEMDLEGH